jgi:hypothetical protein
MSADCGGDIRHRKSSVNLATVADFVLRHPRLATAGKPSFVCVAAAHPIFMVFGHSPTHPEYVVQFGPAAVVKMHRNHSRLYRAAASKWLPRPVLCESAGESLWCSVITGLAGDPWFTLARRVRTSDQWLQLKERCYELLREFQSTVGSIPEWGGSLDLAAEFEATLRGCATLPQINFERLSSIAATHIDALRPLGTVAAQYEHGDFCLNNVIVGKQLHLLDFEHLGWTRMPLHDEFSLTDSLCMWAPDGKDIEMQQLNDECVANGRYAGAFDQQQIRALYLHCLLWQIREFAWATNRVERYAQLAERLEQFMDAPESFV